MIQNIRLYLQKLALLSLRGLGVGGKVYETRNDDDFQLSIILFLKYETI